MSLCSISFFRGEETPPRRSAPPCEKLCCENNVRELQAQRLFYYLRADETAGRPHGARPRRSTHLGLEQAWLGSMSSANLALPGGGQLTVRHCDESWMVVDQAHTDGRIFRWLLSASGSICETLVELACVGTRRATLRFSREEFLRIELLPEYHRAMAAAFGLSSTHPRHFLFLGFGGGALASYLAQHHPRCIMTGVDASAQVLWLAVKFFGVCGPRTRLHHSNVEDFLRRFREAAHDT